MVSIFSEAYTAGADHLGPNDAILTDWPILNS